ncbi:hypothetical protein OC846_003855 [Tilletia horrida]|uniref:Uncharacterized protein n=1 Tax=Tilletia horrida TaxID=155126 RepID=A0AAN6GNP6_9BASI|nr:hypothetical protein OC845_005025 [Tilletia horrida]KAK0550021.1 hypothetical protein OC846_003855 [Tilletia horrida]KAK0568689.1 hypothetical protein OC861_001691 [Tilletia horrida]
MCNTKIERLVCASCKEFVEYRFTVDPCVSIKQGAHACCTSLQPPVSKGKDVSIGYDCYPCRLDAPRRAEEAKKAAEAAKKAAKAAEEASIPKTAGGDADLELHSAKYW